MASRYFTPQTMTFLRVLARHNQRDWFEQNKMVYEETVRTPALQFIADMADELALLSPHFLVQAKKVGGSLMRVHRDVRFAKDKQPYKTNIGIQFRHERGKDVHAPGFYLHIEPGECFVGVGIWRPDAVALGQVRDAIAAQGNKWRAAINGKVFKKYYVLGGESLSRPPRGYAKDHPMLEDLRRKDFIAIAALDDEQVLSPRLQKQVLDRFKAADSFMQFLCTALTLQY
jgi:uncharacterized protein (TIGR02453 family)